ncbi:hypothetical protein AGMMS50262_14550 [Bacteroidia bacterium]|nr:hypothetical protein AGMMS50262_14550 [Bacteroidia bacterium]
MKKLVLFAAVVAAVSLSACKKAATDVPVVEEDTITVVEETPEADTLAVDTVTVETVAE